MFRLRNIVFSWTSNCIEIKKEEEGYAYPQGGNNYFFAFLSAQHRTRTHVHEESHESQSADLIVPHPLLKYEFEYDLANS